VVEFSFAGGGLGSGRNVLGAGRSWGELFPPCRALSAAAAAFHINLISHTLSFCLTRSSLILKQNAETVYFRH